jgi:sugar/nucleoside kinase (ribokinase family)
MRPVRVAVVGNLSLDLVDGGPPRVGGPPYYAARALAALGAPALVRAKSAEADRPRVLPPLEALGLDVEWLPGETTAAYAFSYEGDERTMEVRELGSAWSALDIAGLDAEWVHVGALFRGEFPAETLAALAEAGARLSFDGQGLVRPARSGPLVLEPESERSFLRHVSVLKLSEEEAGALVGGLDEASLSQLGVPEVVVTLGSRGCVLVAEHQLSHVPADPLDVDPTGAGDAFAAAYVVERSRGVGPQPAAERATQLVHDLLAESR